MELYIGGTAQGKKVYVTQVRGIAGSQLTGSANVGAGHRGSTDLGQF